MCVFAWRASRAVPPRCLAVLRVRTPLAVPLNELEGEAEDDLRGGTHFTIWEVLPLLIIHTEFLAIFPVVWTGIASHNRVVKLGIKGPG